MACICGTRTTNGHNELVEFVAACIEEAMAVVKAQDEAEKRALKAAIERAHYNAKKLAFIALVARKAASALHVHFSRIT